MGVTCSQQPTSSNFYARNEDQTLMTAICRLCQCYEYCNNEKNSGGSQVHPLVVSQAVWYLARSYMATGEIPQPKSAFRLEIHFQMGKLENKMTMCLLKSDKSDTSRVCLPNDRKVPQARGWSRRRRLKPTQARHPVP